ncbi:TPR-like protein [Periconia macrospinosa]|uniref:TPR-like protein n=1 Tax=Periconia macrospinosa TaxID=97972 RepID=A0A2V1DQ43_9PLEO|nr:TPR-like protein [Periconia macrospinosa]
MAEGLAVVGIVASIVQLIDFGSRVLSRLEDYQSNVAGIPEAYSHIKAELPALLDALRHTQSAIDTGSIPKESKKAVLPCIEGCKVQIQLLDGVVAKALPTSNDSWTRRSGKALRSLRYDAKVEKILSVIRGYIQTLTYHAAASYKPAATSLPSYPFPTPSSTVPFRRDPHFVNRPILDELACRSNQPASRLALVGLGGLGKSQIAVEHSYRTREKSPGTWIFWIHASSTERFVEGYRKIAERVKIPRWNEMDTDILTVVCNWLSDETNGRWLMIIDNADDLEVFTSRSARGTGFQEQFAAGTTPTLLEMIPQSTNGSILVTSRSRDVAFRLTGDYADIIKVPPMDQEHALTLLQNLLKGGVKSSSQERKDAEELVEALDLIPLAISQAAAYISQRAPRATVSTYLRDLQKGGQDRTKLLQIDLGDARRDGTASNSVIATWQISFKHIHEERPSATRLLSLMCLFNWQGIPETLLRDCYKDSDDDLADFEDDLNVLLCYSLVAMDVDGCHFRMHRLVQFSTIKWLELHNELEYWKERYVILMDDHYPHGEYQNWEALYENWESLQALFPHAQAAMICRPASQKGIRSWASLLSNAMRYASEAGFNQAAQDMGRLALEAREKELGEDHLDTLSSISLLASALRKAGAYKEAELMVRRAIQGREKICGQEDPLTLCDLDCLSVILSEQGNYEEAETILQQVIKIQEKNFGLEHRSTLESIGNLGFLLTAKGRYEEAEILHQRGLEAEEKVLGPLHKLTLASMDNLGLALGKQGKLNEAEKMHRRALEGSKKKFGGQHPDTLICARNLAFVLALLARHNEAEAMHRQVLNDSIKILGEKHPFTLYSFCNLGSALHIQGRYQEAEVMHQQALIHRREVLGKEHPHTLSSMHNLARSLKSLGHNQEARALMKECYRLREATLGLQHPDTHKSLEALNEWENQDRG